MQLRREGELARLQSGFVSSVSHELRTPLAQIRLYLETLQLGRATTDEQRSWSLKHIDRETTRLTHLVENVLRFSTAGAADPVQREPTDVAADVATIVDEFRPLAESRRATIRVEASAAPPLALRADALRHIVLNLLDNAVKYSKERVEIEIEVWGDADGQAHVRVHDHGIGMSRTHLPFIFTRFYRIGAEVRRSRTGTGLGLFIVRAVVKGHRGTITADSPGPDRGSTFTITLPRLLGPEAEGDGASEAAHA